MRETKYILKKRLEADKNVWLDKNLWWEVVKRFLSLINFQNEVSFSSNNSCNLFSFVMWFTRKTDSKTQPLQSSVSAPKEKLMCLNLYSLLLKGFPRVFKHRAFLFNKYRLTDIEH